MEPLKNQYSKEWIWNLSEHLQKVELSLNQKEFTNQILTNSWKNFELKERINHIAEVCINFLPKNPKQLFPKLILLIENLRKEGVPDFNFPYIFLPDIISKVGLEDFPLSMKTIEKITVFTSAEFGIRFFYLKDFDSTLKQMLVWSKHNHPLVRRLASEGSRPSLPWGIGIPKIKKNPEIHLPILENLWNDPDEIVRRSVANHLNDISKINPDLTWNFCKTKLGFSKETDKSLKHALRTLFKKGDKKVLSKYSYDTKWKPTKVTLDLSESTISVGESLEFKISISHKEIKPKKLRLEYKILFRLASGKSGSKIFQLGEKILEPNTKLELSKKHSFKPITTRTYYSGLHELVFVINGNEVILKSFNLK